MLAQWLLHGIACSPQPLRWTQTIGSVPETTLTLHFPLSDTQLCSKSFNLGNQYQYDYQLLSEGSVVEWVQGPVEAWFGYYFTQTVYKE